LQIRGHFQRNGPVNVEEHVLARPDRDQRAVLPDSEWADWDTNGDLLFARQGELFRIPAPQLRSPDLGLSTAIPLADFRPLTFTSRRTPPEAAAW